MPHSNIDSILIIYYKIYTIFNIYIYNFSIYRGFGVLGIIHDPTTLNRQGNDRGTQYRSGIYFTKPEQAEVAQAMFAEIQAENVFDSPLVTEVLPLQNYSAAEEYHQDFFERNPTQGYCMAVAAPKVWKFKKTFTEWSKAR